MRLDDPATRAALTLALSQGVGSTTLHKLIARFGSAQGASEASTADLEQLDGIGKVGARKLFDAIRKTQQGDAVDVELDAIERAGAWVVDFDEPEFPAPLKLIPDPPRLLWGRGELEPGDALALAVVGSRECSPYGREQAARFAAAAADAGLTIVSGGAYGIDAAAHESVLQRHDLGAPARTIAVIGSGLAKPYPTPHRKLFDRIADSAGVVLSELPTHTPPRATQFPARNRIISGLSLGVLVIEAARRSGALITARLAVEEHGRECMALPGRVDSPASAGCHRLIRQGGATLVTHPDDVLEQLGDAGTTLQAAREMQQQPKRATNGEANATDATNQRPASLFEHGLNDVQQRIVATLDDTKTLDEVVAATGLDAGRVRTEMTMLELRGAVQRDGAGFARRG